MTNRTTLRLAAFSLFVLLLNSAYIFAFTQATIFYEFNVLLHLALGLILAAVALRYARRYPTQCGAFLIAAVPALYLVFRGNTFQHRFVLWLHILLALTAVALIGLRAMRSSFRAAYAIAVAILILLPTSAAVYRKLRPNPNDRIHNPPTAPLSMDQEGGGAAFAIRAILRANQYRENHTIEFLHGFRSLRPVPPGYLPAVEKLDASLRILQQSVLPEVH